MLIAGIVGKNGQLQTASLINSILASKGMKVSIIDSAGLLQLDGGRIRAYISELGKNNVDLLLLKTGIFDVDRLLSADIHFDIVIYTDREEASDPNRVWTGQKPADSEEIAGMMEKVFSLMADKGVAIVNVDDSNLIGLLQGMKHHFVTYGFNKKASITTSSIGDTVSKEGFICCLQRSVATTNGTVVEPQEYKLKLESDEIDSHSVLAAASFAIVNGIDLNHVGGIQTI